MDFSQNSGLINNGNPSRNIGPRIPSTQIPNPSNNGNPALHHSMAMPNYPSHNLPHMDTSFQYHHVGQSNPMVQNSNGNGGPLGRQPMGSHQFTPQNLNANGSHFGHHRTQMPSTILSNPIENGCTLILNNPLQCPTDGAVGVNGGRMANAMASGAFDAGYFGENNEMGMQELLAQGMGNDNGFQYHNVDLPHQGQVHLGAGFTGFPHFHQSNAQGNILWQGQQDITNGQMQAQDEAMNMLRTEIRAHQDKITSLKKEHAEMVAALQKRIQSLKQENKTLGRENVVVKSFYNTLRGMYDFIIGPDGKLFPVVPKTKEGAVLDNNKPKPPFQKAYEDKMERLKREYQGVLISADICHLCPLHHSSHLQLQAPLVEYAALEFIDLTGDAPEPGPGFRKDSIQAFLARAAREELLEGGNPGEQTTTPPETITPVQETVTTGITTTTETVPLATQVATANAESSQFAATGSAKRPAPPATPPSEAEDASPSKRPKRKQSDYSWMQPSQNLALRKATGDLPHPLEEWSLKRAAGDGISQAVAFCNVAIPTPAAYYQPSVPPPKQTSALPCLPTAPKPLKVTKTKSTAPKKNARGKSKAKPKSSAALSADLTNALAGSENVTSAAKISGTSSSHNVFSARSPTPSLPLTASPAAMDPELDEFDEFETEEDRAARLSDYDLIVIDHNENYPLPDDGEIPQPSPFGEDSDEDVADIIALLEEPEEHDNQQSGVSTAKEPESGAVEQDLVQSKANTTRNVEQEAWKDNAGDGDGNWDVDSLFDYPEEEVQEEQVSWQDEESEVSEEE